MDQFFCVVKSTEESLKKKIEFICDFCNTTPKFINGSIIKINKTNLTYIEPHRIIINNITFLAFNYSNEIFIENLSTTLTDVDEQFKEKEKTIKTLTENNTALTLRVKTLNNNIKEKDNEISFLKSKISSLRNTIDYWKDKFDKVIDFLHSKLHNWYDKDDKYIDVVNDMYEDNVLDDDDIKDLKLNKEKDDFDR